MKEVLTRFLFLLLGLEPERAKTAVGEQETETSVFLEPHGKPPHSSLSRPITDTL